EYKVNKNNIEIIAGGKKLTIAGLGSKDVTNNATATTNDTSSIILKTSAGEIDLRSALLSQVNVDKSFTGSWLNDYANASAATAGVTMDGKAGNDSLVGSNHADTIKAGTTGNVTISGGKGNDLLYAGTDALSTTTFVFNAGDGKDTVFSGKGEDTLRLNGISLENITFSRGEGKAENDLVIKYTNDDSVTVKDYYKPTNTIKNIVTNEGAFLIESVCDANKVIKGEGVINGNNSDNLIYGSANADTITAGAGNDVIFAKDGNDSIDGGDGNDTIYGGAGNDTISGGAGSDIIYDEGGNNVINAGAGINKIYLADGESIIKNGGGNDTLVLTTENNINLLNSDISGDDIIIRKSNGDEITLENYMLGNHSVKAIQVGDTIVTPEEIKHEIDSAATLINGTVWADNITPSKTGDVDVTVNAGDGNDLIHVLGTNRPSINLGHGNDTVSIECEKPIANIYFENGDGNNKLVGAGNIANNTANVRLISNTLVHNYNNLSSYEYLLYEKSGNDLILKQTNGENFTVENYYNLTDAQKQRIFVRRNLGSGVYSLNQSDRLFTESEIKNLTDGELTYTATGAVELVVAGSNTKNLSRNITLSENDILSYQEEGNLTANITGNGVKVRSYVEDSVNNTITMGDNLNNATIVVNGGAVNTITTSLNGNNNYVDVYGKNDETVNTVNSKGNDRIDFNKTFAGVGAVNQTVNLSGENTEKVITNYSGEMIYVNNVLDVKNTTLKAYLSDVAPEQLLVSNYGTTDNYLSVLSLDADGDFTSQFKLKGTWTAGNFDLDQKVAGKNVLDDKLSVSIYNEDNTTQKIENKKLSELSQYYYMGHSTLDHTFNFDDQSATTYLNMADSLYLSSSGNSADVYLGWDTMTKTTTIQDGGGGDSFQIWESANDNRFRFFFDVDKTGNVVGTDLYVFASSGGTTSDLSKFIKDNDQTVNYLCFKNFFNGNGGHGVGYIEEFIGGDKSGGDPLECNTDSCINAIKANIAVWLADAEGGNNQYDTVMEAIEAGAGNNMLVGQYVTDKSGMGGYAEVNWNGYWT
ncbi:hypothetical protein IJI31_05465, partial [bacterium]|nr:hypothetical protein [bacterium]